MNDKVHKEIIETGKRIAKTGKEHGKKMYKLGYEQGAREERERREKELVELARSMGYEIIDEQSDVDWKKLLEEHLTTKV